MPYKVITAKNRVTILRHTGDWLPLPILPTPTTPLPSDNHQSQKISWIIQILSWPIPYPVLLPFSFPPPFLYIKRLLGEVSSLVNSATARFLVLINVLFTSDGSMGKFGDNKYMGSLHAIFCNPLSVCNYLKMKKLKKKSQPTSEWNQNWNQPVLPHHDIPTTLELAASLPAPPDFKVTGRTASYLSLYPPRTLEYVLF